MILIVMVTILIKKLPKKQTKNNIRTFQQKYTNFRDLYLVKKGPKMTGETPEVRSDKRYLKDIPKISQRCPKDITKIFQRYPKDITKISPMDQWTNGHSTSIALILFKRLRVTLVTL